MELFNVENLSLVCGPGVPGTCKIGKIEFEFNRSAADLAAGSAAHAARILKGIGERFNLSDAQLARLTAPCSESEGMLR